MSPLAERMAAYGRYHRHPLNRATHYLGVPLIVFALMVLLGMAAIEVAGWRLDAGQAATAVLLLYYLRLDPPLGLTAAALMLPAVYAAGQVAAAGSGLPVFVAGFVIGWVFQGVGHWIEGRRPALFDNLFQVFVAPIFLLAEAAFALGLRRDLRERVNRFSAAGS